MAKHIGEIFTETLKMKTEAEVIEHLQKHKSPDLFKVFEATYHPAVKWALPPGPPPFNQGDKVYANNPSFLARECRTLYYFLECPAKIVSDIKREGAFVQRLESLPKDEALILIAMKDGNLTSRYPWLTYDLVKTAFPGLLPEKAPEEPKAPLVSSGEAKPAKKGRGRPKGSGLGNYTKRGSSGRKKTGE